jgi:hypothetical protein
VTQLVLGGGKNKDQVPKYKMYYTIYQSAAALAAMVTQWGSLKVGGVGLEQQYGVYCLTAVSCPSFTTGVQFAILSQWDKDDEVDDDEKAATVWNLWGLLGKKSDKEQLKTPLLGGGREAPSCPDGHELELFLTNNPHFGCDGCGEEIAENEGMHGCRPCDYDLCRECYFKAMEVGIHRQAEKQQQEEEEEGQKREQGVEAKTAEKEAAVAAATAAVEKEAAAKVVAEEATAKAAEAKKAADTAAEGYGEEDAEKAAARVTVLAATAASARSAVPKKGKFEGKKVTAEAYVEGDAARVAALAAAAVSARSVVPKKGKFEGNKKKARRVELEKAAFAAEEALVAAEKLAAEAAVKAEEAWREELENTAFAAEKALVAAEKEAAEAAAKAEVVATATKAAGDAEATAATAQKKAARAAALAADRKTKAAVAAAAAAAEVLEAARALAEMTQKKAEEAKGIEIHLKEMAEKAAEEEGAMGVTAEAMEEARVTHANTIECERVAAEAAAAHEAAAADAAAIEKAAVGETRATAAEAKKAAEEAKAKAAAAKKAAKEAAKGGDEEAAALANTAAEEAKAAAATAKKAYSTARKAAEEAADKVSDLQKEAQGTGKCAQIRFTLALMKASAKRKWKRTLRRVKAFTGGEASYEEMQTVWGFCGAILLLPTIPTFVTHIFPMLFIYCWMWLGMGITAFLVSTLYVALLGNRQREAATRSVAIICAVAVIQSSITLATLFYYGRVEYVDSLHYWWKFRDFKVWEDCWTIKIDSKLDTAHRALWFTGLF